MNKKTLRELYLSKRKTLPEAELTQRNALIFASVKSMLTDCTDKKTIHIFGAITSQFEINTWPIIEWLHEQGHQLVMPKVTGKRSLSHHRFEGKEKLTTNHWGIPEPNALDEVDPQSLDLVFIPMICFDKKGNRIGYGGGYYDTFLQQTKNDCLKIGLCLTPPLDHIAYAAAHDIPLDQCITHLKTYHFNSLASKA